MVLVCLAVRSAPGLAMESSSSGGGVVVSHALPRLPAAYSPAPPPPPRILEPLFRAVEDTAPPTPPAPPRYLPAPEYGAEYHVS
jgi:hypothetical protein